MDDKKLNLAVFISGRGSNLQSLIDACRDEGYPAKISVVLSNKPDVPGLQKASDANIPAITVHHKDHNTREDFENAMLAALKDYEIDLICLAGFMRILTPHFVNQWPGQIINIHPSLLPDYKGTNTHERVLADGKTETGCTVHYVVPDVDSGAIIVQKRVPVLEGDTPDALAARVLEQEHIAYPEAIALAVKEKA